MVSEIRKFFGNSLNSQSNVQLPNSFESVATARSFAVFFWSSHGNFSSNAGQPFVGVHCK